MTYLDFDPIVSVIIPVFNTEKYLRQCLDSVIHQTCKEIQIICVDDGSTDSSKEIVDEYAARDHRIRVIHQENAGLGSARNSGLSVAGGKYISFVDADDYIEAHLLEKVVAEAELAKADIVLFGYISFTEAGDDLECPVKMDLLPAKSPFSFMDVPNYIFQINTSEAWTKLFRRDFLKKSGLTFQKFIVSEDIVFVYDALIHAKTITALPDILYHYRRNVSTSISNTLDRIPQDFIFTFAEVLRRLKQSGMYEIVKQSYVNRMLDAVLWTLNQYKTKDGFIAALNLLKNNGFLLLELIGYDSSYFYDAHLYRIFNRCRYIDTNIIADYVFHRGNIEGVMDVPVSADLFDQLIAEFDQAKAEIDWIRSSNSFRIGRTVTWPIRKAKEVLRRMKQEYSKVQKRRRDNQ